MSQRSKQMSTLTFFKVFAIFVKEIFCSDFIYTLQYDSLGHYRVKKERWTLTYFLRQNMSKLKSNIDDFTNVFAIFCQSFVQMLLKLHRIIAWDNKQS